MRFPALFSTLRRSFFLSFFCGSKFFLFFNNFFPAISHAHTNALYSPQQQTEDPEYSKPPRYTCFARRSVCSRPGKSPGIIKAKEEREQKLFSLFFFSFCPNGTPSFFLLGGALLCALLRFFLDFRFAFLLFFCCFFIRCGTSFFIFTFEMPDSTRTTTSARERERVCVD